MRNTVHILLLSAIFLLSASCKSGDPGIGPASYDSEGEVVLRLMIPVSFGNQSPSTRAVTKYMDGFEHEGKIKDVYAFIFDNSTPGQQLVAICRGYNLSQNQAIDDEPAQFVITVPADDKKTNDYHIVVMANVKEVIEANFKWLIDIVPTPSSLYTYTTMIPVLSGAFNDKVFSDEPVPAGKMPMWGEKSAKLVVVKNEENPKAGGAKLRVVEDDGDKDALDVGLVRSLARVDIGVGTVDGDQPDYEWSGYNRADEAVGFALTEVYIVRYQSRFRVAPAAGNYYFDDDENRFVIKNPSLSGWTVDLLNDYDDYNTSPFEDCETKRKNYVFFYDVEDDGFAKARIYLPESEIVFDGVPGPASAEHLRRTAIVVGGICDNDGVTRYYRIDFAVGGVLNDVLRNHIYRFNIMEVDWINGYDTVEEAYKGKRTGIVFEGISVEPWYTDNLGVVFD